MNIKLHYDLGTVVTCNESGKDIYAKVDHYIIDKKIYVVLMLDYNTDPRLSRKLDLEYFQNKWHVK